MKAETPLDSVLFQLDETRTRCELWITAGDSSERLASGYLTPFLSHLPTVHEQVARGGGGGGEVIRLQAPPCPIVQGSPWFTKRTIERFVRFVSTPDVLERVIFLETERLKLAEATNILITSLPAHSGSSDTTTNASDASFRGESSGFQVSQLGKDLIHLPDSMKQSSQAGGMHSMDSLEVETESSRRHLVNAMDARRLALEKEQRKALARAGAAGFSIDSLRDLMAFADSFAATRLREACIHFGELHTKLQEPGEADNPTNSTNSANLTNSTNSPILSNSSNNHPRLDVEAGGEVRNYGRRRVWGPPVTGLALQAADSVGEYYSSDGNIKDADGALTGEDGESSIKSGTTSSGSRESDWEEDAGSSGKNPVYENVMRHHTPPPPLVTRGMQLAESRSESAAVRRTGIVVIRNVKLPHGASKVGRSKQSETESDVESAESESDSKGGRLSVRAAISLFETKQKQSNDAGVKPLVKQPGKQEQTRLHASSDSAKKEAGNRGGKPEKATTSGPACPPSGNRALKSGSNRLHVVPPEAQKPLVQAEQKVGEETVVKETPSTTPRPAHEISQELLDRSFSCLLKINSVVQDALLSASALQQGGQAHTPEPSKPNVETEAEQWRAGASLDDMLLGRKAPVPGNSRRQTLSTYECAPEETVKVTEGEHLKGRLYDQYQERREAKYKRESNISKAEREAKLKAMQDVLERRRVELLTRSTRLPEKNNTLSAEQMKALKFEAMKNDMLTSNRKEPRSVMHEKPTTTRKPFNTARLVQKQESPTSKSTTRKLSPGPLPPKTATTTVISKNSTRLSSSPRSKLSVGPPVSQRRVGSFMSQSVISESLHSQADLRKENARPPRRSSNLNSYGQEAGAPPSKYSHPRDTNRSVVMPLETNRVVSANHVNNTRKTYGTGKTSGGQVLAPLKITRDISVEQNGNFSSSRIPRAVGPPKPARASEPPKMVVVKPPPTVEEPSFELAETSVVPVTRSSDECIKQIVSCNSTRERQQPEESSSMQPLKESPKAMSLEEVHRPSKQEGLYPSKDFDDEDMQIDDAVEKCMSGRSFLQGISASPLINNFGTGAEYKQELSCSLRTGPSSQSLPHLPRSVSPPSTISSFRAEVPRTHQAKETRPLCKEHHQAKEQPKGLKRLLKFGRKHHRSSDSNLVEWTTINEDVNESVNLSKSHKKNAVEETPSRTSGVRRSLEALPKIADAASEISARNFFSSFRSKSSVCDSRSRA